MNVNRAPRPIAALLGLTLLLAGCAGPGIAQQRRVSQRDMVFSSSAIWNFDQPLSLQTESGRAFAGGGSGAGCTSCK
jgi:hypothetical protein